MGAFERRETNLFGRGDKINQKVFFEHENVLTSSKIHVSLQQNLYISLLRCSERSGYVQFETIDNKIYINEHLYDSLSNDAPNTKISLPVLL